MNKRIKKNYKKSIILIDIFKKKDISNNEDISFESVNNNLPVEVKNENIFKRLLNRLKKIFNKK